MNILIDASTIKSQGGINHIESILKYLVNDENNIFLLSNPFLNNKKILPNNIFVLNFPNSFIPRILNYIHINNKIKKLVKEKQITKFISLSGLLRVKNVENINFLHNLLPHDYNNLQSLRSKFLIKNLMLRFIQRNIFSKSEKFIFFSEESRKISKLKNKNYKIIPHFIDEKFYGRIKKQIKCSPINDEYTFAYPSDFFKYKQHKNLIQIFDKLLANNNKLKLILISNDLPNNSLKNLINKFQSNIEIIKFKKQDDLIKFYRKSIDFIINPSICESFGYITYEALALGLPTFTSIQTVSKSILPKYELTFNPLNIDESAKKINIYLQNPKQRYENVLYAQNKIMKNLSIKNNRNNFINYINS